MLSQNIEKYGELTWSTAPFMGKITNSYSCFFFEPTKTTGGPDLARILDLIIPKYNYLSPSAGHINHPHSMILNMCKSPTKPCSLGMLKIRELRSILFTYLL